MKQPPIYDKTLSGVRCRVTKSDKYLIVDVTFKETDGSVTEAGFPIPIENVKKRLKENE